MIVFTLLTFAASWLLWAAALAIQGGGDFSHPARFAALGGTVYLLGVFAPALVGLALTWVREGAVARQNLLRRAVAWSVDVRWYAFAILYFPLASLAAATIRRMALGAWPAFTGERFGVILAAAVISTPAQAGEELGWRGFLLPRLSAKFGLPIASLILGLIWASWHLPFFYMAGTDKSNQSFPAYATAIVRTVRRDGVPVLAHTRERFPDHADALGGEQSEAGADDSGRGASVRHARLVHDMGDECCDVGRRRRLSCCHARPDVECSTDEPPRPPSGPSILSAHR